MLCGVKFCFDLRLILKFLFSARNWVFESKVHNYVVNHDLIFSLGVSVWQKLEEENQEFFKAYYLRLLVKEQITEFNRLLKQHAELSQLQSAAVASLPNSNGSHIPPCKSISFPWTFYPF